ncbi:hypothetical protein BN1708_009961 [Verticillium longisporum]|uniref:Uncharacterized protein n=1 Tax=Verticillium longisporum TaxID=100787 RepID=A0A0G4KMF7_VERLO|nr:hypothetical protein BN1708_009961 [Verticillium longisporum]
MCVCMSRLRINLDSGFDARAPELLHVFNGFLIQGIESCDKHLPAIDIWRNVRRLHLLKHDDGDTLSLGLGACAREAFSVPLVKGKAGIDEDLGDLPKLRAQRCAEWGGRPSCEGDEERERGREVTAG